MAEDRLDHIRDTFRRQEDALRKLWRWALDPKSKRERYRRFRALQKWATGNAKREKKASERRKWQGRAQVYRRRKRQILTRLRDGGGKTTLGTGAYAGSASFIDQIVMPEYAQHGIPPTSRKRWETYGNPSSDHWFGNRSADALDGGIANAQWLHDELAAAFRRAGVTLSPDPADYRDCYCRAPNGRRYRFEGIAATHGTGPHYHSGVRYVG